MKQGTECKVLRTMPDTHSKPCVHVCVYAVVVSFLPSNLERFMWFVSVIEEWLSLFSYCTHTLLLVVTIETSHC